MSKLKVISRNFIPLFITSLLVIGCASTSQIDEGVSPVKPLAGKSVVGDETFINVPPAKTPIRDAVGTAATVGILALLFSSGSDD